MSPDEIRIPSEPPGRCSSQLQVRPAPRESNYSPVLQPRNPPDPGDLQQISQQEVTADHKEKENGFL